MKITEEIRLEGMKTRLAGAQGLLDALEFHLGGFPLDAGLYDVVIIGRRKGDPDGPFKAACANAADWLSDHIKDDDALTGDNS